MNAAGCHLPLRCSCDGLGFACHFGAGQPLGKAPQCPGTRAGWGSSRVSTGLSPLSGSAGAWPPRGACPQRTLAAASRQVCWEQAAFRLRYWKWQRKQRGPEGALLKVILRGATPALPPSLQQEASGEQPHCHSPVSMLHRFPEWRGGRPGDSTLPARQWRRPPGDPCVTATAADETQEEGRQHLPGPHWARGNPTPRASSHTAPPPRAWVCQVAAGCWPRSPPRRRKSRSLKTGETVSQR